MGFAYARRSCRMDGHNMDTEAQHIPLESFYVAAEFPGSSLVSAVPRSHHVCSLQPSHDSSEVLSVNRSVWK